MAFLSSLPSPTEISVSRDRHPVLGDRTEEKTCGFKRRTQSLKQKFSPSSFWLQPAAVHALTIAPRGRQFLFHNPHQFIIPKLIFRAIRSCRISAQFPSSPPPLPPSLVQKKIPKSTDKLYQSNGKCDTLPVGQESCKYYFTLALPVGQERDIELDREEQMLRIKAARAES